MFKASDYAYQIQVTLKSIFNLRDKKMGGISNTDFIEKNPFIAIGLIMGNFYNGSTDNFKRDIDNFFDEYKLEMGKSIVEIGEEKFKSILADFKRIVTTI